MQQSQKPMQSQWTWISSIKTVPIKTHISNHESKTLKWKKLSTKLENKCKKLKLKLVKADKKINGDQFGCQKSPFKKKKKNKLVKEIQSITFFYIFF